MGTTITFAEELIPNIITAGLATAKGTDIFWYQQPETDLSPTTTITLKDTGGTPGVGAPIASMLIQCLVRSVSPQTSRQVAAGVCTLFDETSGETENFVWNSCQAIQLPTSIGEDDRRRHEYSFNLEFKVYAKTQATGQAGYGGSKDPNIPT